MKTDFNKCVIILWFVFLFEVSGISFCFADELLLRWQANQEPDLEGYEIHYAPVSDGLDSIRAELIVLKLKGVAATRNYDEELSDNADPAYKVTGLNGSTPYVVALKAYDNEGLVSEFSEEYTAGADATDGGGGGGGGCFVILNYEF